MVKFKKKDDTFDFAKKYFGGSVDGKINLSFCKPRQLMNCMLLHTIYRWTVKIKMKTYYQEDRSS